MKSIILILIIASIKIIAQDGRTNVMINGGFGIALGEIQQENISCKKYRNFQYYQIKSTAITKKIYHIQAKYEGINEKTRMNEYEILKNSLINKYKASPRKYNEYQPIPTMKIKMKLMKNERINQWYNQNRTIEIRKISTKVEIIYKDNDLYELNNKEEKHIKEQEERKRKEYIKQESKKINNELL